MAEYKTSAIVLRTYDYSDYDKIVVLYSRERGLLRGIAKGIKKTKALMRGKLEPLMASDLILFEGRNLDIINQSAPIDYFKNLRKDLKKITYALYFAELLAAFGMEDDPQSETYYNLIFNALKEVEQASSNTYVEHFLVKFQLQLISLVGYAPMLDICDVCREVVSPDAPVYFNSHQGGLFCNLCAQAAPEFTELSPPLYKYLLHLNQTNLTNLSVDLTTIVKAHCILLDYIKKKTSYKLKTPHLIEDICLI
jgi:DNA repair protein RecO (recombination protein O)